MNAFPTHPDAVTPAWLRTVTGWPIKGLRWEPIGTGQVGDSVRFHLDVADDGQAPATLASKFPAANEASAGTAAMLGLYAKEVAFYREGAGALDVRVPHSFFAEASEDGASFALIFEDLGPARGGDQIAGCTIEDARAAVCQAAAFHAPSWGNAKFLKADWLAPRVGAREQIAALYPEAQKVFAERYQDILEPEYMQLCEDAAEANIWERAPAEPQCLVHGDFRLDNMLFDIHGGKEPIAILDWQTATAGRAMIDIGYFLGCGIGDELRRAHETELLELYCAQMSERGVALTREDIWQDYRIEALHGLTTAVFSAAFVERTERGDANFLSMARGACALALEHDSLGALKEEMGSS